jgi:hypothetical protein
MTVGLGEAKERKEHERIWDWNYGRRRARPAASSKVRFLRT